MRGLTAEQRFFAKVEGSPGYEDCWIWVGASNKIGYGLFYGGGGRGGLHMGSHRWSWEFFNGPIPDGLQLDHLCQNKRCVNPWHLEPVTAAVNNSRKLHPWSDGTCTKGLHPMTEEMIYVFGNGSRTCRGCKNESWNARYHARKRESIGA